MRYLLVAAVLLAFTPAVRAEQNVDALLARASADGLPADALRSKVREGRAKKVPEARIRAVVQQMMRHMIRARTWLRKGKRPVPPQLMVAVAQARMAGIQEKPLRELAPAGSRARASLRIDTLVDLHLRGYREADALRLVKGVRRGELAALGGSLERLRRMNRLTHAEAADALLKAVRSQKGSLHRAMQSLSRGAPRGHGPATPSPAPKPGRGGR